MGAVVWDVVAGGAPRSFGPAYDFEFGRRRHIGRRLTNGNGLAIFDIATGEQIREIATPAGVEYWDFEIDPTGKLAALSLILARHASTSSTWTPARFDRRSSSATRTLRSSAPTDASWPSPATTA